MTIRERVLPRGWYPISEDQCRKDILEFVKDFTFPAGDWKGGIVPHAGWYFSGKAAARVIGSLSKTRPDRIVIYGGHLGSGNPIIYTEDAWETPLGPAALDNNFAMSMVSRGIADAASTRFSDNTIEVNIPIIKFFFPDTPIIAVHSPATENAVKLAESMIDGLRDRSLSSVFIGSADFTHYGPNYGFMPEGSGPQTVSWVKDQNDKSLIDKILSLDPAQVIQDAAVKHNTCSAGPIASVITSVAKLGVTNGNLIDYYTSYDVLPDSSFVGYAAILF